MNCVVFNKYISKFMCQKSKQKKFLRNYITLDAEYNNNNDNNASLLRARSKKGGIKRKRKKEEILSL